VDSFFAFIENSAPSEWIRGSESIFAFPTIITFHAVGMGFLAGGSAAIDLRILGFAPGMSLKAMRRFLPLLWLAFGVVVAAAGLAVPAASASLVGGGILPSCGAKTYPFTPWGDYDAYCAFPNLGFESGTTGWKLSGASVGSGNEPWYVNGSGNSSLTIGPGGSASTPKVCAALNAPHWRLFAHSNGANGSLTAQVIFYGLLGNITGILNFTSFNASGYTSWEPSSFVPSTLALPLLTYSAQLRLTSTATSGTWQVDDVYVDPWGMR